MPRRRMQDDNDDSAKDTFVIDFSEVKELSDEPLPVGAYYVEVEKASLDHGQDGKPFIQIQTVVVEPDEYAGRKLKDRLYLNPEALWRAKKALRAMGFDVDGSLDIAEILTEMPGKEIDVVTKIDTLPLDGRKVSRINRYVPPEGEDEGDSGDGEDETDF